MGLPPLATPTHPIPFSLVTYQLTDPLHRPPGRPLLLQTPPPTPVCTPPISTRSKPLQEHISGVSHGVRCVRLLQRRCRCCSPIHQVSAIALLSPGFSRMVLAVVSLLVVDQILHTTFPRMSLHLALQGVDANLLGGTFPRLARL
jgi:hypothetical protein